MTTDLDQLRTDLLGAIDAAAGLEPLEAGRVHALGKQGAITGLLKTLGGMSPEERQVEGARIHSLREAGAGEEPRGAGGGGAAYPWRGRGGARGSRQPQGRAGAGRARRAPCQRD